MNRSELTILVIMRLLGVGGLCAIPAILMPFEWMNSIHNALGLGELPDAPIVHYLARSLSAFYALVGALALYVSCDIRRYRDYIKVWGCLIATMGIVLLLIDLEAGLPLSWTLGEGPPMFGFGVIVVLMQRGVASNESS